MNENKLTLHWTFAPVRKTIAEHGEQELYTCASGVTPSGTIHIGNFRELITVDLVTRAFKRMGKKARHIHSWDDNDVFRKVPKNMPQQEMLESHLRKCIVDVPDPFGEEESYAAKHMKDVQKSIAKVGIKPEFIIQSKKYRNCDYAEQIKEALVATKTIKEILNEHRKEPLGENWLPVSIFCEKCKKDTIKVINYPGEYNLHYACECGFEDTFDFREKGIVKLLWRVDWPMRWNYENVNFEPGGKDHSTTGGSYDTGKNIIKEVWNGIAPSYQMYDFIRIKGGGGKISSSTGDVITLNNALEIYEPEIVRYLFTSTRPNSEFAISFDVDAIKIYEDYDKCERMYYEEINTDNKKQLCSTEKSVGTNKKYLKEKQKQELIYEFSQLDENIENIPKVQPLQVGFRHISTIVQIKDLDEESTYEFFKDQVKNEVDKKKLQARITCVKKWIEKYADEQFKFKVKETKDEDFFSKLSDVEKQALAKLKEALQNKETKEEREQAIFDIPKELEMNMGAFFTLCYQAIIGKDKGPKLASFIEEIGKERILKLL